MFDNPCGLGFTKVTALLDVVKEISSFTELQNQHILASVIEDFIKFDQIWVIKLKRTKNFCYQLTTVSLVRNDHTRFDNLSCPHQSSILVLYFIHRAIGTSSNLPDKYVVFEIIFLLDFDKIVPINSYLTVVEGFLLHLDDLF